MCVLVGRALDAESRELCFVIWGRFDGVGVIGYFVLWVLAVAGAGSGNL